MNVRTLCLALLLPTATLPSQVSYTGVVYATVQVGAQPFDLELDLEVPSGGGPFPLVVWIHGGGWSGGSHSPIPGAVTRMVQRGYAAASIAYRLTGDAIWPAQIQDCKAAIRFLRANAATFDLDPDRIAVMGSSAGGHLAAALATMGDVGEVHSGGYVVDLEGSVGNHGNVSSRVQCAVDLFGPTAMLVANDFPGFDHDTPVSPESRLVGGALQENAEKWATVDPITFVTPDDPPMLMLHGTLDTSVPFVMSDRLQRACVAIGLDTRLYPVVGEGHGGPLFATVEVNGVIDAWLDEHLRDLPAVTVSITSPDPSATESGDPASFAIARTGSTAAPLSVSLWLDGDVAIDRDCEPLPLRVTIPAGQSSASLVLVPKQDDLVEGEERARVHLASSRAYRIDHGAASAEAVIHDDEATAGLPSVSVATFDPLAAEIGGNPGAVRFVRSGATATSLTVAYDILGTTTNGVDHAPLPGTLTFPAGAASRLVVVVPLQDDDREVGEVVVLRLRAGTDYVRGVARSGHVVLVDDDRQNSQVVVNVLATGIDAAENGVDGAFQVTRVGAQNQPLVVPLQVSGTASAGADYAALPTSVTIPAGSDVVDVPLVVFDDFVREGAERVICEVVPQSGYVVGAAGTAQVFLADDEVAPIPPSPVALDLGAMRTGAMAAVTISGGLPGGLAAVWFAVEPGHLPLAPFGTVQLAPAGAAPFATVSLDASGDVTVGIPIPADPQLVGQGFWWQAFATTLTAPFLALSDASFRELLGVPAF